MKNKIKKAVSSMLLAFTLVAGGGGCIKRESPEEVAEKSRVAEDFIKPSLERCKKGAADIESLRKVLMATPTQDLKTLRDNNIVTVCFDRRLLVQDLGFFDEAISGVFYNGPAFRVVGLNSRTYGNEGNEALEGLARKIRTEGVFSNPLYAGRESCGKNCTETRWKSGQEFDQDTLRKNPGFGNPPIVEQPVKVEAAERIKQLNTEIAGLREQIEQKKQEIKKVKQEEEARLRAEKAAIENRLKVLNTAPRQ